MNSNLPIGIFDSGIGGLTVAREIIDLMPNEKIIYFGDTLHLPYGEKSKKKVVNYCLKICQFLRSKNCKAIVIACNSASSLALKKIKKEFEGRSIIFNVIDPVINCIKKLETKKIGVIGTNATISSNIYEDKINSLNDNYLVSSLATPLLAPMIESGFHDDSIKKKIIATYLKKSELSEIETLILGCTHYPLIQKEIKEIYKNKIDIINSLNAIGQFISEKLEKNNLLNQNNIKKTHEFYVSDLTLSFQKSAKLFFKNKITLKEKNIFDEK